RRRRESYSRGLRHPDPLYFPLEVDAGGILHPRTHGFTERLDIGRGRRAKVDEKIAVQLGDLRVAALEPAATAGVDQLPRLGARRVLESRAAGAAFHRLGRFARLRDRLHLRGDFLRIARLALKQCLSEHDVVGDAAVAVAESHFGVRETADRAGTI